MTMSFDDFLQLVYHCRQKPLTDLEQAVLRGVWLQQSYKEMAQVEPWSSRTLKDAGSRLWQELSIVLGESVKKNNVKQIVEQRYRQQHSQGWSPHDTDGNPNND
ncbi:MAG: hypothetical protein AB4042_12890 [Leptolyngbyaceae cyanobacterium]